MSNYDKITSRGRHCVRG